MTALFEAAGEGLWLPTDWARGPWTPDALHGGPTAALLTRAVEALPSDGRMQVARITIELLRPVPVAPLRVEAAVLRPGRKIQLAGASAWAGEVEVARAMSMRIRAAAVDVPEAAAQSDEADGPPPPPAGLPRPKYEGEYTAFHSHGVEMRFVTGFTYEPGPATVWIRLCRPVVPDEEPSPAQRVAAVADFGNGVSSIVPFDRYLFINPDLTIHLLRPPVGEWICLDARTRLSPADGMGMAESALYDERGRVGRSVQSLLLDRRA
jgi:hypothetical protein